MRQDVARDPKTGSTYTQQEDEPGGHRRGFVAESLGEPLANREINLPSGAGPWVGLWEVVA